MTQNALQVFDNQPIRTAWDAENEEWLFSIVDVVGVLLKARILPHTGAS